MNECRVVDLKELGVSKEVFDKIYSMGEQDGRADAIDEFVRINKECQPSDKCQNKECVDCIAEQLKEQNEIS